jgi:hypothetical protein
VTYRQKVNLVPELFANFQLLPAQQQAKEQNQ